MAEGIDELQPGKVEMIGMLLRWIFKSVLLSVVMRVVAKFFPSLRRILRSVWR
jgi:hypothetical protein